MGEGGGGGVAPKRNVFLGNVFLADTTIKKSNIFTQTQISIKKQIPIAGQNLYKRIPFSCHTCPLPLL